MKNHIRILGWIYIVTFGLALAFGLTICVLLGMNPSATNQKSLEFIGPPFLLVACLVLLPGLVGGVGLLRLREWARILILILSVFLLPLLPVGSALGLYGFWTLWNAEAQALFSGSESTEAGSAPAQPIGRAPSPVLNLLGTMACVAAGFFIVIKVGFIVHNDPQPEPIANNTLTAVAALVLFAGAVAATRLAIQAGGRAADNLRLRVQAQRSASEWAEKCRQRVAELAADPARAKYAPLVERGEVWLDEHIAYHETPGMTATCEHLQPIERAMRDAGVPVRLHLKREVMAKCRIDLPGLQPAFDLNPPVRYAEFYVSERGGDDIPISFLICDEHASLIHTLHPDETGAKETPWFPTPGS